MGGDGAVTVRAGGNGRDTQTAATILRWLAGWAEAFLWRVEYHASQWADALNRRFT